MAFPKLSRHKKSKKGGNSDGDAKRTHDTPSSTSISTKSAPGFDDNESVGTNGHSLDSPLMRKSRSLRRPSDVGNKTEPIKAYYSGMEMNNEAGSRNWNGSRNADYFDVNNDEMYGHKRSISPIMPEITSIKSQRNSMDQSHSLFRIRSKTKHGDKHNNHESDGIHSNSDSTRQPRNHNLKEPALLTLPLLKTDTLPHDNHNNNISSPPQSGISQNNSKITLPSNNNNEPIAESSPNSRITGGGKSLDINDTPTDVEAHMANTDSTLKKSNLEGNSSGILSSFISAAHNAASHIGTIASTRQADEFKSHPPTSTTGGSITNNDGDGDTNEGPSFMQHLDALLFAQNKKQSREPSNDANAINGAADNDNDDRASQMSNSQSLAHDVVFQPVRKNAISTLGKGELTLEALGFTEASIHSERNSIYQNSTNQVPQISIDSPGADTRLNHGSLNGKNRELMLEKGLSGTKGAPISKVVSGPSALTRSRDDTLDSKRSVSPVPNFKRSLSPSLMKLPKSTSAVPTQDSLAVGNASGSNNLKKSHRRSISSGTAADQSGFNPISSVHSTETSTSSTHDTQPSRTVSSVDLRDFSFANSKRNSEFHSMFKKIPRNERLLEDYSCALQKDILVQGRMYITEQHICFNANILGWTTSIIIPLQEIVQLEKKTIAGLFPNGIVIQTLHQKYIFASFLARDATFDLITNIWNKLVRGPNGNIDMHVDLNDDYSQTDMDSDFDDSEGYRSSDGDYDTDLDEDDDDDDFGLDNNSSNAALIGPMKHAPTEPEHEEISGETKIKEETVDAPLGKVFQTLFGDDTNNMKRILEVQKNKEISNIPKFSKDVGGVPKREYQYIKPLNGSVGPKETLCQVVETIDHKDFKTYVLVTQSTKNPDVPSGNSFTVQTQIYLSWGPKNSTTLTVYSSIKWTAKSWIKSAVEKGTIDGQKESINILIDELKSIYASGSDSSDNNEASGLSSLPTVGPSTHEPTDNDYQKSSGDTIILDETFSAPLGTLYSILFGDDSSYYKSILESQKNFDITTIPNFTKEGSIKKRQYSYTKPLNGPIGPKQTRCNITETIEHFDVNKYILVSQITASPDVPSGNSFTVHTKFYFSWGPKNQTKLFVITSINWTAKSWIKGPIEKGTIDGQNESIKILVSELKSILNKATSGGKKSRKSRGKSRANTNSSRDGIKAPIESTKSKEQSGIIGFLNNFQAPNSFGLMVGIAIFLYIIVRLLTSSKTATLSINGVQKVLIDGHEYMIMPSIDESFKRERLKEQSEYEIWKWIHERSKADKKFVGDSSDKDHKDQDLSEMVRLAEQHLQTLKKQIEEGGMTPP